MKCQKREEHHVPRHPAPKDANARPGFTRMTLARAGYRLEMDYKKVYRLLMQRKLEMKDGTRLEGGEDDRGWFVWWPKGAL